MNHLLTEIVLLADADATGVGKKAQLSGRYCFAVAGTFGGATVGLELLGPDGATWIAIEDSNGALSVTEAKAFIVELPSGQYRATVSGGDPEGLYAILSRVID